MMSSNRALASLAMVALLVVVALVPMVQAPSKGAPQVQNYDVEVLRGETYTWSPSFSLDGVTVTVAAWGESFPASVTSGQYSALAGDSSTYASVSGQRVIVVIDGDYDGDYYCVTVRGESQRPSQYTYANLRFVILDVSMHYDSKMVTLGQTFAVDPVVDIPAGKSLTGFSISPALPAGIEIISSTGTIRSVVSGSPTTEVSPAMQYVVTAQVSGMNTGASHTISTVMTLGVSASLVADDRSAYAVTGARSVSVAGPGFPSSVAISSVSVTDAAGKAVATGAQANGLTISASDGAVTGTPTKAGVYVYNEHYVTNGGSVSRTVTVTVEDKVDWRLQGVTGSSVFNYYGHEGSYQLFQTSGPESVTWAVTLVKKGSNSSDSAVPNPGFRMTSDGRLVAPADIEPGNYQVKIKIATANSVGAAKPHNNYESHSFWVKISEAVEVTGGLDYYTTVDGTAYDAGQLSSNLSNAQWSVEYNSDVKSGSVIVSKDGRITSGSVRLSEGTHYATVKAQDPNNPGNLATAQLCIHVASVLQFTNAPVASMTVEAGA